MMSENNYITLKNMGMTPKYDDMEIMFYVSGATSILWQKWIKIEREKLKLVD